MSRLIVLVAAVSLVLSACSTTPPAAAPASPHAGQEGRAIELPPTHGVFDYQLGGPSERVETADGHLDPDVVVRDASAPPPSGAYGICYVNGFQTQPGEEDAWLERSDLLLGDGDDGFVRDPAWPDELVLDPSTESQRAGILEVLGPVIASCAAAGYDAVEIDNLDTWTRFPEIDRSGAHALAAAYVALAHEAGLAIGQKNAAEIAPFAHDELGFDFAISEECAAFDECGDYTAVYGDHLLQVEYPEALDEAGLTLAEACSLEDRAPTMILRDRDLAPAGDAGHRYERCD
ncbi:endo alpha-1,4 polygalactosaminidase [Agromyces salentinus]|uniref:Endo alpha-1,4 polygalactosaminidase n=1 Tax=Agromyces salentinus TaxID=269421 RepID=A0ABP4ZC24_9MICO|nr:endo alpha-1,4 polygalactosaminidase [Agromyces salentinus]